MPSSTLSKPHHPSSSLNIPPKRRSIPSNQPLSLPNPIDRSHKDLHPLPHTVPLPPSPPATDALNIDDDGSSEPITTSRRPSRSSRHASSQPNIKPIPSISRSRSTMALSKRVRDDEDDELDVDQTGTDHHPLIEPASPISSPLGSSPTARKAHRHTKRVKLVKRSLSPDRLSKTPSDDPFNSRDSPNNPFLAKEGETERRAGAFTDEKSRKLVYVFRGKRIQYDPGEDLHNTGDSPFTTSAPRLLFPRMPSPPPRFELHAPSGSSNLLDCDNPSFQTPKRKNRLNDSSALPDHSDMIPTPRSHARRHHHQHPFQAPVLALPPTDSGLPFSMPLSKAMR